MELSHILERNSLSWKSWLETSLPIMSSIICFKGHIYSHLDFFMDLVQDEGLGHNCKTLMNRCLLHATTQTIFQASQHSAVFSAYGLSQGYAAGRSLQPLESQWYSDWFCSRCSFFHADPSRCRKKTSGNCNFYSWFVSRTWRFQLFIFLHLNFSTGLYGDRLL